MPLKLDPFQHPKLVRTSYRLPGKSRLVLDLNKLRWDKVDDLRPLLEKLSAYRSHIRLILPKLSASHPELMLLVTMFHQYKGYTH